MILWQRLKTPCERVTYLALVIYSEMFYSNTKDSQTELGPLTNTVIRVVQAVTAAHGWMDVVYVLRTSLTSVITPARRIDVTMCVGVCGGGGGATEAGNYNTNYK